MEKIDKTQRAYTLRLRGENPDDTLWCKRLWQTHEALNKGVKTFADWILTLRGGINHKLVYTLSEKQPTEEEKRNRRIILALSWLSVESEKGAPTKYIVPNHFDAKLKKRSKWKTLDALEKILKKRGVSNQEIKEWKRIVLFHLLQLFVMMLFG